MISLDDALAKIATSVTPISDVEPCPLHDALGRVCAEDIRAPRSLPPFTNTGVDGYAFISEDSRTDYKIVGASYAGEPYSERLEKGQAVRIATGAVLPDGADTVAMQEICTVQDDQMILNEVIDKGQNIRHAGNDIREGDVALIKGTKLSVRDIAMLGALGVQHLSVYRPLNIAIASTGTELADAADIAKAGHIIDTNSLMLSQMITAQGVQTQILPSIHDDYDATYQSLKSAAEKNDVIVTTGGVSVGDKDFIRDVLHDHAEILFWKIALRPGKPVLVARLGQCIVIGLPGNPVSAFVTCNLIVKAVIRSLTDQNASLIEGFSVPLAEDMRKPDHLRCFMRARLQDGKAHLYKDQSSNLYSSLTNARGLIDLPVGQSEFKEGDMVVYRPFSLFD